MKIALKQPDDFIGVASLSGPLHITYFEELLPVLLSEHGSTPPYTLDYSGNVTQLAYSMAGAFSPDLSADPPIQFPVDSMGQIKMEVMKAWEPHNPINLIGQWKGDPAMAIFTYCGGQDEFKLTKPNQMFSDSLNKYHFPHTYVQDPNGDHVVSLFTSMPQGINFLYNVMDTARIDIPAKIVTPKTTEMQIYPNPATDRIYLSGNTIHVKEVAFYNLLGQVILQTPVETGNPVIDVNFLPKGAYLVKLRSDEGADSVFRLVKK
jgi:hypothetical protein